MPTSSRRGPRASVFARPRRSGVPRDRSDSTHPLQRGIGHGHVEGLGIEVATDPSYVVVVLFVVGITDGLEELGIAIGATAIFGRAGSLAVETHSELQDQRDRVKRLDNNLVSP